MDASSSSPFTAANSSMAANSTDASVSSSYWKYGVFLSFRGEDTRNNFTSHLYKALDQKGIDTFKDDMKLIRGEELSPAFVKAIQRSRCSIIVLSENYASSKWCLEELVKILECKRTKNQRVVPIFYNVDPSHVRNQTGSFGEALSKHEKDSKIKEEKVRKWREALTQVANLSGWNSLNKSEAQLIEEIAVNISKDSNCVPSKDTQILVGVDSKIRELESLLCLESTDVRMIGIWGMGGIGKTTLARAIYEKNLDKFEGYCFLANVGDLARKGEDYLKKELLSRILKDKNIDVAIPSLKARLHSKKVLIVIDNVNNRSILKWLVGESSWFGPQSRIIITTRDKHFFTMCGVNAMYEVKKLQNDDAIELFNHYAFRNSPPTEDVMELIHRVIAYAQGLPLALEVLGSSLCNKSKVEWVCLLNKLKKIPDMEIQRVLEISFDELDEDQKGIFLDIVFIFRGEDKDLTTEILNSCGFSPISGIKTLLDKSLLSIRDHKLYMHDLLVEMGKDIVRRTSPKEPGKRSRLCMQQDIRHVLQKNTGTEEVEVIALDLCGLKEIRLTTAAFAKMTKLRVLSITECSSTAAFAKMTKFRVVSRTKLRVLSITECSSGQMQCEVYISDDFKFHYDELRYLLWDQYPLNLLPSDFESENLVCLRMPNSHLTQLWEGNKVFENLKYMILDYSKYLTETPDFSMAANLKILSFKGCTELCKIHPSLGDLDKLTGLSLENCQNLKHFPGLGQLVSLEILVLSGCSKLEKFPDISQHMPCLSNLYLGGTAITQLPSSIDFATELVLLDLKNCTRLKSLPNSICKLARLETLSLSGCSKLEKFPDISQHMPCLSKLYLDETAITELPSSIDFATELVLLDLKDCTRLQSLPNSICKLARLETLSLSGCSKLEKFPDISQEMPCLSNLYLGGTAITELPSSIDFATELVLLDLKNCTRLQSLPNSICKLARLKTLSLSGCSKLEKFPDISQHMPCLSNLYLDETAITELPSSIDFATELVLLDLKNCTRLQSLPNSICKLARLETLSLSGCPKLEKLPDISQHMPCLSNLYLCGTAITQLPAIDFASKLVLLDLKNCTRLQSLPNSICKLACLKTLSLSGCSKLEKFPNISQHMPCLSELYLDRTAITELPSSIDFATKLVVLNLKYCTRLQSLPNSICKLARLESLYLSGCSRLGECQVGAGNLDAFPRNLNRLSNLRNLELQNCKSLRALPVLPPRLRLMNASDCPSLKNISPQSVFNLLGRFLFPNCFQMRKLSSQMEPHLRNMATHVGKDRWRSTYAKEYPYVNVPLSIVLPGSTIPDWFMHYGKGHEVKIDVNPDWYDRNFLGFALSAVIAPKDGFITSGWVTYCDLDSYDLNSKLESSRICSFIDLYTFQLRYSIILSDHLWLAYIPSFFSFNDKKWNSIKFSFSTSAESCIVKHCAVCPLYIKGGSDRDCSNGKSCSMEGLGLQTGNDNNIDHKGNPSGSVLDDLGRSGLKDTKIRRCREEQLVLRKRYNRLNNLRDSQAWFQFQERHQMQLNPPTSDIGPHFWIFITIFMLLFLACIFYLAP